MSVPEAGTKDAGLTLLELVVALAVTGAAVVVGHATFAALVDAGPHSAHAEREVEAAALRAALRSWVSGARLAVESDEVRFRGLDGVRGDFPADELTFLTTSDTPLGRGETLVRLYVDASPTTPERGLVAAFSEWRGHASTRLEVAPAVDGLELRFLSDAPGRRRWLPSWISSSLLPAAVELTLSASGPDSLPALIAFPIVVPLRAGR